MPGPTQGINKKNSSFVNNRPLIPTVSLKASKFRLKHYFHCICPPPTQTKELCEDVIYEGKTVRMIVVLLLKIL